MIYDLLAGVVENHLPFLRKKVEDARLFVFPGNPGEVLPDNIAPEVIDYLDQNFVLPFDCVAVEDPATCLVLWDDKPEQRGIKGRRYFIDCQPDFADISQFREGNNPEMAK